MIRMLIVCSYAILPGRKSWPLIIIMIMIIIKIIYSVISHDINHDKNLYRSTPPPSSLPPHPPTPHFHWCLRDASPKASLMFTNALQKYCRYITDHLSRKSAIVTECSANIRLYRRCFGEHSPNHRKSIYFIGTAGIYAQNHKASWSIACIIIHFTIADAKIPDGTEAWLINLDWLWVYVH